MKPIRFLLFPFAVLYDFITCIRNFLYDKKVLKSTSFSVPIIAVGNLNVGGTGKTPQIEYLIRLLKNTHPLAVLSRGYKRKLKGYIQVNKQHTAADVGDEPLQFFKKFSNITVAVDANRVNGVNQLLKTQKPSLILLDDAFQHRKIKAKLYILLTKFDDLYTNDFLLPTGNLRENRRGAKRATIIIVTKCPENLSENEQKTIIKQLNPQVYQTVFFTTISYNENLKGECKLSISSLKNKEVVLVTGIANPSPLIQFLTKRGIKFTHINFPDHHHFSSEDLNNIRKKSEGKMIITTEKDYVRLNNALKSVFYIAIETQFISDRSKFDKLINHYCPTKDFRPLRF